MEAVVKPGVHYTVKFWAEEEIDEGAIRDQLEEYLAADVMCEIEVRSVAHSEIVEGELT